VSVITVYPNLTQNSLFLTFDLILAFQFTKVNYCKRNHENTNTHDTPRLRINNTPRTAILFNYNVRYLHFQSVSNSQKYSQRKPWADFKALHHDTLEVRYFCSWPALCFRQCHNV